MKRLENKLLEEIQNYVEYLPYLSITPAKGMQQNAETMPPHIAINAISDCVQSNTTIAGKSKIAIGLVRSLDN